MGNGEENVWKKQNQHQKTTQQANIELIKN